MDDIAKFFTPIIAFVLPGLTALYGLSFHMPVVRVWFGTAADKDTTVGGFFFVVLASLAVGLVVSGIRWMLVDWWMPQRPSFDYRKRSDEKVEAALADIRAQHYAYFQFYSNMACALVVAFVGWQTSNRPPWMTFVEAFVGVAALCVIMLVVARDCLNKYDEKTTGVLGIVVAPKKSA